MPEELWTEVGDIVQEAVIKTICKKKKCKKEKWLSEEALQIAEKRTEAKDKGIQMFKLDLEKAEEPENKLPASIGSSKN